MFLADSPSGTRLGNAHHERPIGKIVDNPGVIDTFSKHGYGDVSSLQSELVSSGNAAASHYPRLARIKRCEVQSAQERAAAVEKERGTGSASSSHGEL